MKARLMFVPMIASLFLLATEVRAEVVTMTDSLTNGPCQVWFDKTGPEWARPGETITYRIRIRELSGCTLTTLRVEDHLPRDVRFEDARPRPSDVDRDEVEWEHQLLRPYDQRTYSLRVRVDEHADGWLRNVACIHNRHLVHERYCTEFKTRIGHGHDHEEPVTDDLE